MTSENIDSDYYKRLASSFPTYKLELIDLMTWVMSHNEKGRVELQNAVRDELSNRKGLPVEEKEQEKS